MAAAAMLVVVAPLWVAWQGIKHVKQLAYVLAWLAIVPFSFLIILPLGFLIVLCILGYIGVKRCLLIARNLG